MINIFDLFKENFLNSLNKIATQNNLAIDLDDLKNFTVEPSKDIAHGDLACNIAMVAIKRFSKTTLNHPKKLAQEIIANLDKKNIEKLEIAGAGFINITLKQDILNELIFDLITKDDFAYENLGGGVKINLEYASPNPTGPIHIGHARGAIYGDVLANLLSKVGYDVLKEYYINDAGMQIDKLIKSVYIRFLQELGKDVRLDEDLYPGEYLIDTAKKISEKEELSAEEFSRKYRNFIVDEMVELIKDDLKAIGIIHDSYFSEKKNLHDKNQIEKVITQLKEKDLIYLGKLEAPKSDKGLGTDKEEYHSNNQLLFRSTKFGDDQDRVVQKDDGSYTYFAADIAYSLNKFQRGAKIFIMPLGFDHSGYVKRLTAAVKAVSDDKAVLKIILCQMVKFVKNSQPLKMSKRAGNFVTAREVANEVGSDALRFIMLTRKNDAPFDFDLAKVIEQSKDNPMFYVQYAHARSCSVLRNLENDNPDLNKKFIDLTNEKNPQITDLLNYLKDSSEINLIKKIANFPRIINMAAVNFEPHRIAFYLQELSAEFHALWNKGAENHDLKFIIKSKDELTLARIFLVKSVQKIIAVGLDIFNISAMEEMR